MVTSTQVPSTEAPSTQASSTQASSTQASSTQASSTQASSTQASSTQASSTQASSTQASSTQASSTQASSTQASSTQAPSTQAPPTQTPSIQAPKTVTVTAYSLSNSTRAPAVNPATLMITSQCVMPSGPNTQVFILRIGPNAFGTTSTTVTSPVLLVTTVPVAVNIPSVVGVSVSIPPIVASLPITLPEPVTEPLAVTSILPSLIPEITLPPVTQLSQVLDETSVLGPVTQDVGGAVSGVVGGVGGIVRRIEGLNTNLPIVTLEGPIRGPTDIPLTVIFPGSPKASTSGAFSTSIVLAPLSSTTTSNEAAGLATGMPAIVAAWGIGAVGLAVFAL
ncbi:Hypothetical protein R9X50_00204300 [Acrodontium crateriforme]|uniref:Uncharacterized protein n=1 Tax=Acrodontium crateriforme TaxID=150365 RepID=A0AAQ3RAK8_9PEZI|nr:Hypothetical protein R9X50_00204300 [Acrodontium crateriforme]